jgi:pimeloyl-ACP methyl ester carboxylesterase
MIFDQASFKANTKIIETPNGSFPLVDYGEGTPILLLHGFPDSKELWRYQIPALAAAGYRVIAPDLKGYGNAPSPLEKEQYTVPILMSDVIGILDAIGIKKTHLVGHDWGANLSWLLATYYKHRFSSLTALSIGFHKSAGWTSIEQRQKIWYFYLFLQEGLAEQKLADFDWHLCKEILRSHPKQAEVLERMQKHNALTTSLNWYRGNLQHMVTQPDIDYSTNKSKPEQETPKIEMPVLGIWGEEDDFLLEPQMKNSAEYVSNFTYKKLAKAGHWLMLENPEALNSMMLSFWESINENE